MHKDRKTATEKRKPGHSNRVATHDSWLSEAETRGFAPPVPQGRTMVTRLRVVRLQNSEHSHGDVDGKEPQDDQASLETRGAVAQPQPPPLPDRSALPLTELFLPFGHATIPFQSGPAHSSASRAADFGLSGGQEPHV